LPEVIVRIDWRIGLIIAIAVVLIIVLAARPRLNDGDGAGRNCPPGQVIAKDVICPSP
jgi:hypothetical protein